MLMCSKISTYKFAKKKMKINIPRYNYGGNFGLKMFIVNRIKAVKTFS